MIGCILNILLTDVYLVGLRDPVSALLDLWNNTFAVPQSCLHQYSRKASDEGWCITI